MTTMIKKQYLTPNMAVRPPTSSGEVWTPPSPRRGESTFKLTSKGPVHDFTATAKINDSAGDQAISSLGNCEQATGIPGHIISDSSPSFVSGLLREALTNCRERTASPLRWSAR